MMCPHCRSVETSAPTGPYRMAESDPFGVAARAVHGVELARNVEPISTVEVHACPQCEGAYLVHGALEKIENVARVEGRERDSAAAQFRRAFARPRVFGKDEAEKLPKDCPQCDGPMIEREWGFGSMVYVDVCLECRGTWLDVGELDIIRRFFSGRS